MKATEAEIHLVSHLAYRTSIQKFFVLVPTVTI